MKKGMDDLVRNAVRAGLFETKWQSEELTQFLGMVQRFMELLSERSGAEWTSRQVVRIIIEEADFDNCSILLWNRNRDCLSLLAAFGTDNLLENDIPRTYNKNLSFSTGEGIAGQVFSRRQSLFIEDVRQATGFLSGDGAIRPLSLVCLPLLHLGVLNLSAYHPHQFSSDLRRNWELLSKIVGYLLLYTSLDEQMNGSGRPPRPDPEIIDRTDPGPTLELSAPQDFSAQLIEHTPQGICVLSVEGNIRQMNKSFERMLGRGHLEIKGRSPAVFFQDPQVFMRLLKTAGQSQRAEITDASLVNSQSGVYPADVCLVKLADDDGTTTGYLLVVVDTSKRKALADQILRTEKLVALETMAAGVAHDFNNLLMTILGNVQMISYHIEDEQLTSRLRNIEKAVHEGAQTVRRLQQFHEPNRTPHSLVESADLGQIMAEVAESARPRWQDNLKENSDSGDFQLELEPGCMAAIRPSDLHEVVGNLISNAVEELPTGGTVTLQCYQSEGWIVGRIADTGKGIGEEVARRIFDPFYTTKGIGHSGLGLCVAMSLIHRTGGEIDVHSKLGKGSTFTIRLPRAEGTEVQPSSTAPERKAGTHRLLIVDDESDVLTILRDMLRFKGHKVVALQDPEEALQVIDEEDFDLVLTDLGMPVVSGWDIAKRVKDKHPEVPVILLTGWGVQYEEQDLTDNGVDKVLSKPLSWEDLLETVQALLTPVDSTGNVS